MKQADGASRRSEGRRSGGRRPEAEEKRLLQQIIARRRPPRESAVLSRELLGRFGRLGNILRASEIEFSGIAGFGADVANELRSTHDLLRALARREVKERPMLGDRQAALRYCRLLISGEARENFFVLFLDRSLRLIAEERLQVGTVDHVAVYPREVLRIALAVGACAIVLAHNHPSGNARPSAGDVEMTRRIAGAAAIFGIAVLDHIIVGDTEDYSFARNCAVALCDGRRAGTDPCST